MTEGTKLIANTRVFNKNMYDIKLSGQQIHAILDALDELSLKCCVAENANENSSFIELLDDLRSNLQDRIEREMQVIDKQQG